MGQFKPWRGVLYCGLSGIPLGMAFAVLAMVFGRVNSINELVFGFLIYVFASTIITFGVAFLIGFPVFTWLSRTGSTSPSFIIPLGGFFGFLIYYGWIGRLIGFSEIVESLWVPLIFMLCGGIGAYCFWLGAVRD